MSDKGIAHLLTRSLARSSAHFNEASEPLIENADMMEKRQSGVDKWDEGEVLSTPKSLGRRFVLRYLEVYEVVEEVSCFAAFMSCCSRG